MTDREVMRQALLALEGWDNYGKWAWPDTALEQSKRNTTESLASLRAALEQPDQEPVHGDIRALKYRIHELEGEVIGYKRMLDVAEAPPQRKPLTDEQIEELDDQVRQVTIDKGSPVGWFAMQLARAIEQAHGIGEKP